VIVVWTDVPGVALLDIERHEDERGFFARTFCRQEFLDAGLDPAVEQCNVSYNHKAGTLRGMHWQADPAPEAKLVRVTRGGILDQIVDLRQDSPARLRHVSVELTAENGRALYVPPHFAHGFQTLADDTEVFYQISERFTPGTARGLRYDDPALGLSWPLPIEVISEKDLAWASLEEQEAESVSQRPQSRPPEAS
jgi:dTDP-4-dehydrorhamnose 3,5-epimerase